MNIGKYSYLPERVIQIILESIDGDDDKLSSAAIKALKKMEIYDCESPIEYIFVFSYIMVSLIGGVGDMFALIPQAQIKLKNGKVYYADFLLDSGKITGRLGRFNIPIRARETCKIVIECDGHDFHEVTKEQVARRNERDYHLKSNGFDVIRFSGSQIYNDPFKCAKEAFEYIFRKCGGLVSEYGDL